MSSQSSFEFYGPDLAKMPPLRAIAETLILDPRVRTVNAAEAYKLACQQHDVAVTDMPGRNVSFSATRIFTSKRVASCC